MKDFAFTGGRPDPYTFPTEGLIAASEKALRKLGGDLVNYPGESGYSGLRELASMRFERREGIPLPIDNISITSGSMQALELVLGTFINPGDTVLTEEYTYSGTLGIMRHFKANIAGVSMDYTDGMDMDALASKLKELKQKNVRPSLIYTTSNHQNPTGAILSLERRKRMLALAEEYDTLIVEDDCYGDIDFTSTPTPDSLFKLDSSNRVIFIATFSKILGAGVRQGYFVARQPHYGQIHQNRWDGGTSALASAIVAEFFTEHLEAHLVKTNAAVGAKCRAVVDTLDAQVSDLCTWTRPRGGLFLWIDLPETTDMQKLQQLASEKGVGYSNGSAFHYANAPVKSIRLAYAYCHVDDIPEGITYLCEAIRAAQGAGAEIAAD
ncbi:PLP-dependent aminotransferase family protein [Candidatus Poribacteria bacterium]|nr:PLP-dependent aminotransferase family protein [Candidatus Poribacteria bacterium]MYA70566.1 PLP-dependent aminotransferase family protein [Candidatus Poribacteria bacterium]MYH80919.1 PLP-dependent aminotransferase family protein [Candidatus Poribacteria bacterium]MYK95885.1 PLP-dependent aminotransferase family protein [Candidatus Poribacteria bacterium]